MMELCYFCLPLNQYLEKELSRSPLMDNVFHAERSLKETGTKEIRKVLLSFT